MMLSDSEIREKTEMVSLLDMAEHKRLSVLFSALRYGIKARSRALECNQIAYDYLYDSLLQKCFIGLKSLLLRKRRI